MFRRMQACRSPIVRHRASKQTPRNSRKYAEPAISGSDLASNMPGRGVAHTADWPSRPYPLPPPPPRTLQGAVHTRAAVCTAVGFHSLQRFAQRHVPYNVLSLSTRTPTVPGSFDRLAADYNMS